MITIQIQVPDDTPLADIYYAAHALGSRVHEYVDNVLTFRPDEKDEAPKLDAGTINEI